MGAALAFTTCIWGMSWPWLCALAMVALPMGAALSMAMWLCHGYFPIRLSWPWEHAHGQHGPGNVSKVATLALATCLLEGYFPKKKFSSKRWFFFFFFLKGVHLGRPSCLGLGSMPTGAVLAFASCLWELPWLWRHAHLAHKCCIDLGCIPLI